MHTSSRLLLLLVVSLAVTALNRVAVNSAEAAPSAIFTVNSTGDDVDPIVDGICDTGASFTELTCTLRAAIKEANATPAIDTIAFNIPSPGIFQIIPYAATISPNISLPNITRPVIIDGTTQPRAFTFPNTCATTAAGSHSVLITLDGSNVDEFRSGLTFVNGSQDSVLKNIAITNWSANGVKIDLSKVELLCNHIGVMRDGTTAAGNGEHGVLVDSLRGSQIGGPNVGDYNVISGNGLDGIHIVDSSTILIEGNYIGTGETGASVLPNGRAGVQVVNSSNTVVGPDNIISSNMNDGVIIAGGTGNMVRENVIGANEAQDAALGNGGVGVRLDGANDSLIGGTSIFNRGNLIAGNLNGGVVVKDSAETRILDNQIGRNNLPNGGYGIEISGGSSDTTIGSGSDGNSISHNTNHGIYGHGVFNEPGPEEIAIDGNSISSNFGGGLVFFRVTDIMIGTASGNTVVNNMHDGISLETGSDMVVQNNSIGLTSPIVNGAGNGANGIRLVNSTRITIGDEAARAAGSGAGNTVSYNLENGILLDGSTLVSVQGNHIGTTSSGTTNYRNELSGILLNDRSNTNTIGTIVPNQIKFNQENGITINDTARFNTIRGNIIANNEKLGIDINNDGVTANDVGDVDTIPNAGLNYPVLDGIVQVGSTLTVTGTLDSDGAGTVNIDFYQTDSCDASGYGEADSYIGELGSTATTGNLDFTFVQTFLVPPAIGSYITALTVDADGNTSEFARCIQISSVPTAVAVSGVGVERGISAEIILILTLLITLSITPLFQPKTAAPT